MDGLDWTARPHGHGEFRGGSEWRGSMQSSALAGREPQRNRCKKALTMGIPTVSDCQMALWIISKGKYEHIQSTVKIPKIT